MVINHPTALIPTKNVIQQLLKRQARVPISTNNFIYTISQYIELIKATVATSAISIICSFLIISAFLYLRFNAPEKSNRISLRCVFLASTMNLINAIFDIIIIVLYGDTASCRTSGIIALFARVMSAAFLAVVGLNLVVVFVFNNSSTSARRLELFYYPCIIIYGLIAVAVPIAESVRDPFEDQYNLRCFYFIYYHQLFGYSSFSWMWFYGWLFFTIVIAVICSCIALVKLVYEHRLLITKFTHIASSSFSASTIDPIPNPDAAAGGGVGTAEDNAVQQRIKYHSNIFMRVISRCVVYPLVPLISNIWGFVFQLMLTRPHTEAPGYGFSLTDAIFKCLQGFFVAIVFFSDPAMTHFIADQWKLYKAKYIDDYSQIRRYSNGHIEVLALSPEQQSKRASSVYLPTTPSFVYKPLIAERKKSNDCCYFIRSSLNYEKRKSTSTENSTVYDTVPMRRLSVPPSVYNRLYQQLAQQHFSWEPSQDLGIVDGSVYNDIDEGVTPTVTPDSSRRPSHCIPDPQSTNRVLVPYKYPRLASAIHWTLLHCGVDNNKKHQLQNDHPSFLARLDPDFTQHRPQDSTIIDIPPPMHPLSLN